MPVTVSLKDLCRFAGTKGLWPSDFAAMVAKIDDDPNDMNTWGVAADWLDEFREPELAHAFRWVHRRGVEIKKSEYGYPRKYWQIAYDSKKFPTAVREKLPDHGEQWDQETAAGLACAIAEAIRLLKEEMF